ncbi:MAG: hypothetical protein R3C12_11735 [Planctomycetaceae bacterium]
MGANVRPLENLVIRPEVRYYFADPAMAAAVNGAAAFDVQNNPGDPYDGFIRYRRHPDLLIVDRIARIV